MVVLKNKNLKSFVSEKLAELFKLFKTSLTKKESYENLIYYVLFYLSQMANGGFILSQNIYH